MKNFIVQNLQKLLLVILCAVSYDASAAEKRLSSEEYREFAYQFIMQNPWDPAMANMIKISWNGWSPQQKSAIANRVPDKRVLPPQLADKMISRTEFCTVAYLNIMKNPWNTDFGNLVDNCWENWSEKERSAILNRISEQGIRHMRSIPKEQMLRGVADN